MTTSVEFYDGVADRYAGYSAHRAAYLECVETLVARWAGRRAIYLDVGAGDGRRSVRIARAVGASRVTLLDNSPGMLAKAQLESASIETVVGSITDCALHGPFDLVTCLWNVFGHLSAVDERRRALENIRDLMSRSSLLVLDVNNRYNARQYGGRAVCANLLRDLRREPGRGEFPLELAGRESVVYIHHPFEIDELAESAGLTRGHKAYVDYDTGRRVATFLAGQAVYGFRRS